jgi:hypothetical protein
MNRVWNALDEDCCQDSHLALTAALFLGGGLVTAVFSGSLARLTTQAGLAEVLFIGMVVPTFTWAVQLTASAAVMPAAERRLYWVHLGWICLLGSFALLPAAFVNLVWPEAPRWLSAANVLASVALMGVTLFRLTRPDHISAFWPISWCATITLNMTLFLLASWHWWQ